MYIYTEKDENIEWYENLIIRSYIFKMAMIPDDPEILQDIFKEMRENLSL